MNISRFSVVLPCFNIGGRFNHFIQGVCSVVNQTLQPAELLIVDDGSSDNSVELIEQQVRPLVELFFPLRLIRLKENSGVSIARNRGIIEAKSDYLAFIDFDDLWFPQYLESIARVFNEHCASQLVLSKTIFWTTRKGRTKARVQEFPDEINEWSVVPLIDYVTRHNFPVAMGSAVACRKAIFARRPDLMFDEFLSKETAEDVHFGLKFLASSLKPYFLSKPLVIHRTFFIRSVSRSQGAHLFKDELKTHDYMVKTVGRELIQLLVSEHSSLTTNMLALQADLRNKFLFKSNFLHCKLLPLISQLISRPILFKQLIRLLVLKLFGQTDLAMDIAFAQRPNSSVIRESVDGLIANQKTWYDSLIKPTSDGLGAK